MAGSALELRGSEAFLASVVALVAVTVLVRELAYRALLQTGGVVEEVAADALDALVQVRPEARSAGELAGGAPRRTCNDVNEGTRGTLGYAVGCGYRRSKQVIVDPAGYAALERCACLACGTAWSA